MQRSAERTEAPPALVVGGTGMLSGVVPRLVAQGRRTAVVGRRAARISALAEVSEGTGSVVPAPADYRSAADLSAALARAVHDTGPFRLAILWVHTPHRAAVYDVLQESLAEHAVVIEVVSSSVADPSRLAPGVPEQFRSHRHRRVILGFADGEAGTRWLTHQEISQGVVEAIEDVRAEQVVGRVRPWSDRP